MKFFTKKSVVQKIIIAILIVILSSFCIPKPVNAFGLGDLTGTLTREFLQFLASLGDLVVGGLNYFMYGAEFDKATLDPQDPNLTEHESWLYAQDDTPTVTIEGRIR